MDKNIVKVLEMIEEHGFEAYVVGGYVRDYIMGIESTDVDICTNALPMDLVSIFDNSSYFNAEYGSFKITTDTLTYDFTTYRKEIEYKKGKPSKIQ